MAASCEGYRRPDDEVAFVYDGDTGTGIYTIDPEGDGSGFDVYCEMTSDGGG